MTAPSDFDARDSSPRPEHGSPRDGEEAVEPEFLDEDAFARPSTNPNPGPGVWEALVWIISFYVIELGVGMVWGTAAMLVELVATGRIPSGEEFETLLAPQVPYLLGLTKILEVFFYLGAIRWRFGPGAFRLTGFRPIPPLHVLILALAVIPTSVLSGQLYAVFTMAWDWLAQSAPVLENFKELSSVEAVQEMARTTPLLVLIVTVAVLPALNEEFLFRALIGRGLVGRYGVVAGVALTSMLFAAVHLSPTQAAALLPLAVVMHMAYLSSGSIWLAVLVHFVNNALSVVFMVMAAREGMGEVPENALDGMFDPGMLIASACCVTAAVWLLWRMRVQWRLPHGGMWTPTTAGAAPPEELQAERVLGNQVLIPVIALVLGLMLFTVAYGINAWQMALDAGEAAVGVFR